MAAPTQVDSTGRIIASGLPAQHPGFRSNIQGGLLEHGAAKTAASIAAQSAHAQKSGATMRGGSQVAIPTSSVVEGGTVPGVSAHANTAKLLGGLNGLRTAGVYDHLGSAQPYRVKLGGKRKKRTKRNKKHGRYNSHRNSKRGGRKHSSRTRRSTHSKRR